MRLVVYCVCVWLFKEAAGELRWAPRDEGYNKNRRHCGRSVRNVARLLYHLRHWRLVYVVWGPAQTLRVLLLARIRQLSCQPDPLHGLQGRLSWGVPPAALSSSTLSAADGRGVGGASATATRLLGTGTATLASRRHLAAALLNVELDCFVLHDTCSTDTYSLWEGGGHELWKCGKPGHCRVTPEVSPTKLKHYVKSIY